MAFKLTQLPTSSVVQHRPLTELALDNKIRAMLSQFHPRERRFALLSLNNTLGRIYTYNESITPSSEEYSKPELLFSMINSPMMEEMITIDEFSLMSKPTDEYVDSYKKVTEWLGYFNHDCGRKDTIRSNR